jgi:hypothetical protein
LIEAELERFRASFLYEPGAFLVDEVVRADPEKRALEAVLDTSRPLPLSDLQRPSASHPAHVAAGDLLQVTGSLGCLHAWLFHGCRWEEGWVGFGARIHRVDFERLVERGAELRLTSRELRSRVGPRRIVLRLTFEFFQSGARVYFGEQSAMFLRAPSA